MLETNTGRDQGNPTPETLDMLVSFVNEIDSDEYCESVHTLAAHAAFTRHLATELEDAKSGGRDEIWMHDMQDPLADKLSELASYFDAMQKKSIRHNQGNQVMNHVIRPASGNHLG